MTSDAGSSPPTSTCAEVEAFRQDISNRVALFYPNFNECESNLDCVETTASIRCPEANGWTWDYAVNTEREEAFLTEIDGLAAEVCPAAPPPLACGGGISMPYTIACVDAHCRRMY
jgi:hypothetical protein